MPYIGNDIQFGELTSQTFTGDGSTVAFTMGYSVANTTSILVTSGNVVQEPTVAYTVSGTTLTFTSAPEDDDTIHVRFLGRVVDVANAAILQDSDQDTKIQVEESADEDTIRFDIAGAEDFTMTANDFTALSGSTISTNTIAETTADTGVTIDGLLVKDGDISATSELTVNEAGADVDFRIESDTNTNAFHVDSGRFSGVGSVGIGRAADATVDVLIGNQAVTAGGNASHYRLRVVPEGAVTIPSGTAAEVATLSVFEPNITATGTVTTAASLWVHSAPTEATNNFALYVDDGLSKFDGAVVAAGGVHLGVTSAVAANLLDDYEEGTYTATLTNASSGSYTVTAAQNTLAYTKVGRLVSIVGRIAVEAESSPSGQLILNLPFAVANTLEYSDSYYSNSCVFDNHADSDTNANIVGYVQGGAATVIFYQITHGTGATGGLDQTDLDAAWGLSIMLSYNA